LPGVPTVARSAASGGLDVADVDTDLQDFSEDRRSLGLREADVDPDPLKQFQVWLDQALAAELPQPLGMTLATATCEGRPSARQVLLRGCDAAGFVFYTNYDSRKAQELTNNPRAALVFYWAELDRQVRIEGRVERITAEESDAYFQTRPHGSRLGAIASPQSQVIPDRTALEQRMQELKAKYEDRPVPRPANWGGYRVIPDVIEFWQGRANRLHDRLRYRRAGQGAWHLERLAP
jgi:pyridoxamine 5'-phosphate oxidase